MSYDVVNHFDLQ